MASVYPHFFIKNTQSHLVVGFAASILALGACAPAARPAPLQSEAISPGSAEALIHLLHTRYSGQWYRTLSFKQNVIRSGAGAVPSEPEVWVEYADES